MKSVPLGVTSDDVKFAEIKFELLMLNLNFLSVPGRKKQIQDIEYVKPFLQHSLSYHTMDLNKPS